MDPARIGDIADLAIRTECDPIRMVEPVGNDCDRPCRWVEDLYLVWKLARRTESLLVAVAGDDEAILSNQEEGWIGIACDRRVVGRTGEVGRRWESDDIV